MASLEERLNSLEGRNKVLEKRSRLLMRAAVGGAAVAVLAIMVGLREATPEPANSEAVKFGTVEAREITLVDKNGKIRVAIGVDDDGAGIDVRDAHGNVRVVIGEGKIEGLGAGSGAWVFDEQERPRVGLGVGKEGTGLIILDEKGKPVAGDGKGM